MNHPQAINLIWLMFGMFNFSLVLRLLVLAMLERQTVNIGWFAFIGFFAVLMGPVWTLGVILYKALTWGEE